MAHAAHMKAHFTSLVPEESRHEYVQEHKMGFCTQFKHCETNPFYPDVVQADGNAGWYSTDQSGWIGQSDDPAGAIGSGGEWVNGELPASGSGTYEYNWGSFVYPTARGNGGLGGGGHPMGMLLCVSEARSVICVNISLSRASSSLHLVCRAPSDTDLNTVHFCTDRVFITTRLLGHARQDRRQGVPNCEAFASRFSSTSRGIRQRASSDVTFETLEKPSYSSSL